MSAKPPDKIDRIAVLRANALGDYIFALPALQSLKDTWPEAELVLLGTPWHKRFVESRPGPVDRVVCVPKCKGIPQETDRVEDAAGVEAFFAAMRDEHFDLALQMHGGGGNSNPFVRKLGARRTIGLRASGAPGLDVDVPYVLYHNEVMRYLEVAIAAGARPTCLVPRLHVTDADLAELAESLPARVSDPVVVLHPGASDVRRRWPAAKMAALADWFDAAGYTVCITGVAAESELVDGVVGRANSNAVNLCGRLSLNAMTALLDRACLLVSNDTGPLHVARAVGTSTIGIYWFGNVINAAPPQMRGHRYAMSWTTHCPACGMDCVHGDAHLPQDGCDHEVSFVDEVDVDTVAVLAGDLLGNALEEPRLAAL